MKWQDYAPEYTTRVREDIEWSISYTFNANDRDTPRVLLIGDSICNGYHKDVRSRLDGRVNVTFWASSKCVTDPDYFRELNFMLDSGPFAIICFNNGLHSLSADRAEWTNAYASALDFIHAKHPDALISVTLNTPVCIADKCAQAAELNDIARAKANERGLPVIDLFSAMDVLDRTEHWRDDYHFHPAAIGMQADIISAHVLGRLGLNDTQPTAVHVSTATGPDGKVD